MHLFTNLKEVKIDEQEFKANPILKLSVKNWFSKDQLSRKQIDIYNLLDEEARTNGFSIIYL